MRREATRICTAETKLPIVRAGIPYSSQAAALAAIPDDLVIDLTTEAAEAVQELVTAQCTLDISKFVPSHFWTRLAGPCIRKADFSKCFDKQGEGAEDLLQVLARCEALEELNLEWCQHIPGPAWAKVRGAQWHQLKIANFESCFDVESECEGAEDLLQVLARCEALEELNLADCEQIPGPAWAKVRGAQWPKLQKAKFSWCFSRHGEGAEDLLEVLVQCEALEELNLFDCKQIPSTAWAKVRSVQWPKLKKADFYACFCMYGDGAEDLLQGLWRCHALEEVDFYDCEKFPASAWQQLPDGCWPKLRSCPGIPEDQLPRLRGQGSGGAGPEASRNVKEMYFGHTSHSF
eukprot:Skav205494  [mRNA]  locus=scaffold2844:18249:28152:- [translate_table: standard]